MTSLEICALFLCSLKIVRKFIIHVTILLHFPLPILRVFVIIGHYSKVYNVFEIPYTRYDFLANVDNSGMFDYKRHEFNLNLNYSKLCK